MTTEVLTHRVSATGCQNLKKTEPQKVRALA